MEIPKTLSWVQERARCSPKAMFNELAKLIENDVKDANALADARSLSVKFKFERQPEKIIVERREQQANYAVTVIFKLTADAITVNRLDDAREVFVFSGTPNLTPEGECVLAGEKDLYPWQFSRRALEDLFFSGK
jgi:hypothetical protein